MMIPRQGAAAVLLLAVAASAAVAASWASTRQEIPAPATNPATTAAAVVPAEPTLPTVQPDPAVSSGSASAGDQEVWLREQTRLFVSCYLAPADPQWRLKVSSYLSGPLAAALDTVDPARVPAAAVSTVSIEVDDFAAQAVAQTTAGSMTVTWTWSGDRWEVTSFVPPAG